MPVGALSKAETEGQLGERLAFYCKPKLLIVDREGLDAHHHEPGRDGWGTVAAAIFDRLLHHSFT